MERELLTFGHGTLGREDLVGVLRGADVAAVVDVRRFPGSRRHPHVAREALESDLPAAGIAYTWEPRLGGRRSLPSDSPDIWWQVAAFRAYAGHMRSPEFLDAIEPVLEAATGRRTAVMCSETLWWRCHRRLIADFVVLARRTPVLHLGHDGRLRPHEPAPGAALTPGGVLVYAG